MSNTKYLNLNHARNQSQKDLMKRIQKDKVCPFCRENLEKYHPQPIIKETKWWLATKNMAPYKGGKIHLLFIYKPHAVAPNEIKSIKAQNELIELTAWAIKRYKIKGGSLFMRFGDTEQTGSTVAHLHAQLIVGNAKRGKNTKSLKVKLGYYKL